jgi:hypothetical protein
LNSLAVSDAAYLLVRSGRPIIDVTQKASGSMPKQKPGRQFRRRANANMSFMKAEILLRCEQHFHPGRIRVGGLGPFEWSGC